MRRKCTGAIFGGKRSHFGCNSKSLVVSIIVLLYLIRALHINKRSNTRVFYVEQEI